MEAQRGRAYEVRMLDDAHKAVSDALAGVEEWEESAGFWWTCAAKAIRGLRAELKAGDAVISDEMAVDWPDEGLGATEAFGTLLENTKTMDVEIFGIPLTPTDDSRGEQA